MPKINLDAKNFRYIAIVLAIILFLVTVVALISSRNSKEEKRNVVSSKIAGETVEENPYIYLAAENTFQIILKEDISAVEKDKLKNDLISKLKESGDYSIVEESGSINVEFILEASSYRQYDMFKPYTVEEDVPDDVILD